MKDINIIYEDNHLLVVNKPNNIPTCKDSSNDPDLLTILKKYIKDKYQKPGEVYLGMIHRLDRPTSGIIVFAKTSKAASRLSKQIQDKTFKKTYYAIILNKLKKEDTLKDYLSKNEKTNTSYIDKSNGKLAKLSYQVLSTKNNLNLVKINLDTGRHHQIRVQFSSRNNPLYGDHKYTNIFTNHEQLALIAKSITFKHPTKDEILTFDIDLPNKYPWNLFS